MEQQQETRRVRVFKTKDGAWFPIDHFPHPSGTSLPNPPPSDTSKEVEHNAFWPWGQAKYLHRIEYDGTWWYCGPSQCGTATAMIMMENARERGEVIQRDV